MRPSKTEKRHVYSMYNEDLPSCGVACSYSIRFVLLSLYCSAVLDGGRMCLCLCVVGDVTWDVNCKV